MEPYSVAQHSVHVSYLVDEGDEYDGLMHDSPEYVINDMQTPFKKLLPDYLAFEERIEGAILPRMGVRFPFPPSVKRADMLAHATEVRDLLDNCDVQNDPHWSHIRHIEPLQERIVPLDWREAERLFLQRFEELGGYRRWKHS